MHLRLVMLGKTRRPELRAVIDDYVKRLSRYAPIEVTELRETEAALKKFAFDQPSTIVLLDAAAKNLDSQAFAKWLGEHRDRSTRLLVFVCGGADGFPEEILRQAHQKLSLSAMTYSHELARAMLAEQLYRAFAILSGSAYPK
ncbi:MAG: 23S rRNA (pseudouridine(1915)-N(3))-methyltransferase RlmH [Acidobacteriota bacterium]|nr:23S rRNA (pseudouridine(1915)-N(3))-methyltransferase RlmH [Acidobacteriota bacterium]